MNSLEADVELFPSSLCRLRADRDKWDLSVVTPGPDRRYNPDVLRLNRFDLPLVREKFLEAFRKMEGLCRISPESRVSAEVKGAALTFKVETDGQGGGSVVVMLGGFRPALVIRTAEQFDGFVAALDDVERRGEDLCRKSLELDRLEDDAPAVSLRKVGEGPLKVWLGNVVAGPHVEEMVLTYGHELAVGDPSKADIVVDDEATRSRAGEPRRMTTDAFLAFLKGP